MLKSGMSFEMACVLLGGLLTVVGCARTAGDGSSNVQTGSSHQAAVDLLGFYNDQAIDQNSPEQHVYKLDSRGGRSARACALAKDSIFATDASEGTRSSYQGKKALLQKAQFKFGRVLNCSTFSLSPGDLIEVIYLEKNGSFMSMNAWRKVTTIDRENLRTVGQRAAGVVSRDGQKGLPGDTMFSRASQDTAFTTGPNGTGHRCVLKRNTCLASNDFLGFDGGFSLDTRLSPGQFEGAPECAQADKLYLEGATQVERMNRYSAFIRDSNPVATVRIEKPQSYNHAYCVARFRCAQELGYDTSSVPSQCTQVVWNAGESQAAPQTERSTPAAGQ